MDKYKKMQSLNSVIGKVAQNLGINNGLKQITLLNFWPQVVGKKFEKNSRAVSVANKNGSRVLIVGVSSSAVAQELQMFKADVLKKIIPLAKSLGLNIDDIYFSTKYWENETNKNIVQEQSLMEVFDKKPTQKELDEIKLPYNIEDSIKESILNSKNSDELKERMLKTAIDDAKTHIWKRNNGFPFCEECGVPLKYRKAEGRNLCPSCEYNE